MIINNNDLFYVNNNGGNKLNINMKIKSIKNDRTTNFFHIKFEIKYFHIIILTQFIWDKHTQID